MRDGFDRRDTNRAVVVLKQRLQPDQKVAPFQLAEHADGFDPDGSVNRRRDREIQQRGFQFIAADLSRRAHGFGKRGRLRFGLAQQADQHGREHRIFELTQSRDDRPANFRRRFTLETSPELRRGFGVVRRAKTVHRKKSQAGFGVVQNRAK